MLCIGVPTKLQREFVYRFNKSESGPDFPSLVSNMLKSQIAPGVQVRVMVNSMPVFEDQRSLDAAIFINQVVPVFEYSHNNKNSVAVANGIVNADHTSLRTLVGATDTKSKFSSNQVNTFIHTLRCSQIEGNKSNITVDNDYVDVVTLQVKEYFPAACMRQAISLKESKRITPIEVATEEFELRSDQLREQLKDALADKTGDGINKIKDALDLHLRLRTNDSNPAKIVRLFLRPESQTQPLLPQTHQETHQNALAKKAQSMLSPSSSSSPSRYSNEYVSSTHSGMSNNNQNNAGSATAIVEALEVDNRPSITSLPLSLVQTAGRYVAPGSPINPQSQASTDGSFFVFDGNSSSFEMIADTKSLELKRKLKVRNIIIWCFCDGFLGLSTQFFGFRSACTIICSS
jgi:hypothetical protein